MEAEEGQQVTDLNGNFSDIQGMQSAASAQATGQTGGSTQTVPPPPTIEPVMASSRTDTEDSELTMQNQAENGGWKKNPIIGVVLGVVLLVLLGVVAYMFLA